MSNKPVPNAQRLGSGKRTARLAEAAFQKLQEAILSGSLREGEVVRESRLARQWDLGRTPMREAVRRAAESGYLVLRPNRAPLVRKLTADDIRQIYSLRETLECVALKSAWGTFPLPSLARLSRMVLQAESAGGSRSRLKAQFLLDRELHRLWMSNNRNPWLTSILERLLIYRPNLVDFLIDHTEFSDQAFEEHRKILKAIQQGSLPRANGLLARHIRRSGSVLAALLEEASRVSGLI